MKIYLIILLIVSYSFSNNTNSLTKWESVANSPIIAIGNLIIPEDSISSYRHIKKPCYVNFVFHIDKTLKGPSIGTITIRNYLEDNDSSLPYITLMNNDKSILFAKKSDEDNNYYLVYNIYNSITKHTPNLETSFHREIIKQDEIINNYKDSLIFINDDNYMKVKKLIKEITTKRKELKTFKKLESLGYQAVPSIIRLLDDNRELPIKSISLENNFPDAFEAVRHYGPEKVVDALSAILNQITETSFGFIYNGGSENERNHTINGWRIYYYYELNDSLKQYLK